MQDIYKWPTRPGIRLRRWLVENYPLSQAAARDFVKREPEWATTLLYILPQRVRYWLLADRALGMRALVKHPELFPAKRIKQYVVRHKAAYEELPMPVLRIIGAPPFTNQAYTNAARISNDVGFRKILPVRESHFYLLFANAKTLSRVCSTDFYTCCIVTNILFDGVYAPGPFCNTVADIAPCLPPAAGSAVIGSLSRFIRTVPRYEKYVFTAGRLPPPIYAAFVARLVDWEPPWQRERPDDIANRLMTALTHEMRSLRLPSVLLDKLIQKHPRTAIAMHEGCYIKLSPERLQAAQRNLLCSRVASV